MRISIAAIMLVAVLLASAFAPDAGAAEGAAAVPAAGAAQQLAPRAAPALTSEPLPAHEPALRERRLIAYKQDSGAGFGELLLRLAGGLVLMTVLALAIALLAKRYVPGIRGYSVDGKNRVQLLESQRITPKLTVFVLEFEGRRLLLAQSGDRVVEIGGTRVDDAHGQDASRG